MTAFLHMGGYARFLWPSYGITFAVILLNVFWAQRLLAGARAEARRRLAMQESVPQESAVQEGKA
ncbi:MAG TPA: heme exporter protein CcmD [Steroidobacteraceae bacterium]|nr:heme exporter protein CcmD [Steroidobacteraceae bacterium]